MNNNDDDDDDDDNDDSDGDDSVSDIYFEFDVFNGYHILHLVFIINLMVILSTVLYNCFLFTKKKKKVLEKCLS